MITCASKRHRVAEQEPICRVTGLARQEFLIASTIKPGRDCSNSERLSGANGLLLSPHLDKLRRAADRSTGLPQELLKRTVARGEKGCWRSAQASMDATRVVTSKMKPCSWADSSGWLCSNGAIAIQSADRSASE
jgi:hypothetical protein